MQPVVHGKFTADGVHDVLRQPAALEMIACGGHVAGRSRPQREARNDLEIVAEQLFRGGLRRVDGERRLRQQCVGVGGAFADLDDQPFEDRLELEPEAGDLVDVFLQLQRIALEGIERFRLQRRDERRQRRHSSLPRTR